jgi:hypothetical protein
VVDKDQPGLRFWRPAPYILIANETKGNQTVKAVKIVYLPDKSEEYAIQVNAGVGSASFEPTLTDGWQLTGFKSTVDSQADEVIKAIATLVGTDPKLFRDSLARSNNKTDFTQEGLYRLVYGPEGHVIGLERVDLNLLR